MILYHGSTLKVEKPNISKCRTNTDFGRGFYCTTSMEQAQKWAKLKQQRQASTKAIVSVYEIEDEIIEQHINFKVLKFTHANKEWLDFVYANRKGMQTEQYDIVFGPVANDRLFATITLYEEGILSANAAIEQLKTHLLFNQISFHSQQAIEHLNYKHCIKS